MSGTLPSKVTLLLLLLLLTLPAAAQERAYMLFPPQNLSPDSTGLPGAAAALGDEFAAALAEQLGKRTQIADAAAEDYPREAMNRTGIERFALAAGADAIVSGFFLLERRGGDGYFARLTLYAADLTDDENRFSRNYQGRVSAAGLPTELQRLAEQVFVSLSAAIPPLTDAGEVTLAKEAAEAESELRARRTVTLTLLGRPDPAVEVILPDGSSAGTLAEGSVTIEIPSESLYRLRLEKPEHYTRILEGYAERDNIELEIPWIYPVHSWDIGFSHSYLRPFGLLAEARLRLFDERVVAGSSFGTFLLPDYTGDPNPEPDFSRLMVENELGFQLGWYIFSPPDAVLRLLIEANTRINSYTMTNQGGRTFLALMSGTGLRLEVNQLNWILHTGIRVYFPHLTPSNELEGGIVLLNGGLAWKF